MNNHFMDWHEKQTREEETSLDKDLGYRTPLEKRKFFAIGQTSGYPNYYLIKLDGSSEEVYFFDHERSVVDESECISQNSKSLTSYLSEVFDRAEQATEDSPARRSYSDEDSDDEEDDVLPWNPNFVQGYPKKSKYRVS
jgi:hypothetical protein